MSNKIRLRIDENLTTTKILISTSFHDRDCVCVTKKIFVVVDNSNVYVLL